jgi:Flp pilus assembly protein TadD
VEADELLGLVGADDPNPRVLEDFCPLDTSLERVLLRAYYEQAGAGAFTGGEVPFGATSGGQLSQDAATILFASLERAPAARGPIRCLELGPGTGLFAKLLLDELRCRCGEQRLDYYDRITLVLADSSHAMLDAIASGGLLADHEGHYELVHSDPLRPAPAAGEDGLQAVFLNYVLDCLPASVLRRAETGIEQLCVRTCLERNVALEDYTALSLAQVIELAGASEETSKQRLADIYPALVIDVRYEPVAPAELPEPDALDGIVPERPGETFVHGHGAVACLRAFVEQLTPGGFILVNDFASAGRDPAEPERSLYPIYGGALAVGLNFTQIERAVARRPGASFHAPAADEQLVSRLIGRQLDAATAARFAERFDPARLHARGAPRERARQLIDDRRPNAARAAFAQALALAPSDWTLHEQAASFLAYVAKDREAARALARHGLELNPLSTGLWNVLGDCELHARRPHEALRNYERAIELNPHEVRGRYNSAYALTALRDHAGALRMLAEAMALDDGSYRERLLGEQARILDRLARRHRSDRDRIRDRVRLWRA